MGDRMKRQCGKRGLFLFLCAVFLLTACAGEGEGKAQEEAAEEVFRVTGQDERRDRSLSTRRRMSWCICIWRALIFLPAEARPL